MRVDARRLAKRTQGKQPGRRANALKSQRQRDYYHVLSKPVVILWEYPKMPAAVDNSTCKRHLHSMTVSGTSYEAATQTVQCSLRQEHASAANSQAGL